MRSIEGVERKEREGTFIDLPYQEVLYPSLAINQVYSGSHQVSQLLIQPACVYNINILLGSPSAVAEVATAFPGVHTKHNT
jgi:hypothetical protein